VEVTEELVGFVGVVVVLLRRSPAAAVALASASSSRSVGSPSSMRRLIELGLVGLVVG
jgi:hypothetical protein